MSGATEVGVAANGNRYRITHDETGALLVFEWWIDESKTKPYSYVRRSIDFRSSAASND